MFRQEPKRPATDSKKQPAGAIDYSQITYPHRLNFYNSPPTAEITLDEFEQWAIDRLRILGEIESCLHRNKSPKELSAAVQPILEKLSLSANTSRSPDMQGERKKDHYSHYILRLAFARTEDLRRRFARAESELFKLRFNSDDTNEKKAFIKSLDFDWETVGEEEKRAMKKDLVAATGVKPVEFDKEDFFKVDWERVCDLVEQRRVLLRGGKAYVPVSQQLSLVLAEFTSRLNRALELTARALPRLDEDDRLIPILNHLSLGFTAPEFNSSLTPTTLNGAALTASSIDGLAQHFPMCMRHLHTTLRRDRHLKHFGRLQYNLFLKGIGLSVEEALIFWRSALTTITEDKFQKEHRYNIRHAYGLEGTRRNYRPLSCQQILTDRIPNHSEAHGCPYRHFSPDNLIAALSSTCGVSDRDVIRGVREDIEAKKYHVACSRVFEHVHSKELKREKDSGVASARLTDTIIHPNEYFSRSFVLKNPGSVGVDAGTARATGTGLEGDDVVM